VQLHPRYTVRFHYPDGWQVDLTGPDGTEEHHYYFAEGRCEGSIAGRFRPGNHPRRAWHVTSHDKCGEVRTPPSEQPVHQCQD
jgi:hypothetical protein